MYDGLLGGVGVGMKYEDGRANLYNSNAYTYRSIINARMGEVLVPGTGDGCQSIGWTPSFLCQPASLRSSCLLATDLSASSLVWGMSIFH